MPTRSPRPCLEPGCGQLTRDGRCPAHAAKRRQAQDERRGSARARGYDARWERLRRMHLARDPLCVFCRQLGRATAATVVDHIRPHRGDRALLLDADNLQSLCKRCHDSTKQRQEKAR